ncbi:MAG: AI-2E family transporter, partial [Treponema sp.]|nr:AI-2E family transporter [Treponema sp.]
MKDRFKNFNSGRANFFLVGFIAFVLACAVLKAAATVLLPFTIALLLAFVMMPLIRFFQTRNIPLLFSILLVLIIIIAGLYFMGVVLFSSGRNILSLYPRYENRLTEIYIWIARFFDLSYDDQLTFIENIWGQLGIRNWIRDMTFSFSNVSIVFLQNAFMVSIFVVFLLIEAAHFKDKIDLAFEDSKSGQIIKIGNALIVQVSRYLSIKFVISLVTGLVVAILLRLNKVEFALVWGVIQFILNFIPSLGSIVAGMLTSVFALIQFWPEPGPIAITVLIMLGVNMIIGNVLEPKIMGDNMGLSPIVVLLSLTVWGWLWGFAGMILAVPMMVIIKIICENISYMEPLSIILGSRRSLKQKEPIAENNSAGEKAPAEQQNDYPGRTKR